VSIQQLTFNNPRRVIVVATGGTITYDGDFAVHTFTESGNFTITYKATSGLTYNLLCVGGGAFGFDGQGVTPMDPVGAGGNAGGSGANCKTHSGLSMDAFTDATVTVGEGGNNYSSFFDGLYTNLGVGSTIVYGGAGGGSALNGYPGQAGLTSSITGSPVVYGSSGGGGGGGGDPEYTPPGSGGSGIFGSGLGGFGGVSGSDGGNGYNATYGYGNGGGGGGGAGPDGILSYSGGIGGFPSSGVVIVRYRFQQ
jgi:hypothetical protein